MIWFEHLDTYFFILVWVFILFSSFSVSVMGLQERSDQTRAFRLIRWSQSSLKNVTRVSSPPLQEMYLLAKMPCRAMSRSKFSRTCLANSNPSIFRHGLDGGWPISLLTSGTTMNWIGRGWFNSELHSFFFFFSASPEHLLEPPQIQLWNPSGFHPSLQPAYECSWSLDSHSSTHWLERGLDTQPQAVRSRHSCQGRHRYHRVQLSEPSEPSQTHQPEWYDHT